MATLDEYSSFLPSVISGLPQAVIVVDKDSTVHYMNDGAVRMFGYARGEVGSLEALIPSVHHARHRAHVREFIANPDAPREMGKLRLISGLRKNGTEFPAEATIAHLKKPGETPLGLVVVSDITGRVPSPTQIERYAESVAASSEMLAALDLLEDRVVVLDKHWQYLFANRATLDEIGLPKARVLGKSYWQLFPDLVGTPLDEALRSAFIRQSRIMLEHYDPKQRRWYRVDLIPSESSLTVISSDITPVKRSQNLSHQLLRTLDMLADPIMMIDGKWRATFANQAACRYVGKPREDMLGRDVWGLFPNVLGTSFETAYRKAMSSTKSTIWEAYYPPKDAWFRNRFFPTSDGIIVHTVDITAHKHNEQRMKELQAVGTEPEVLEAFSSMSGPVIILDRELRFTYLNAAALAVNGRKLEDVVGKSLSDIDRPITGEQLISGVNRVAETGEPERLEINFQQAGKWFQVDIIPTHNRIIIYAVDITKLKESEASIGILTEALGQAMDESWNRPDGRDIGKSHRPRPDSRHETKKDKNKPS
jgi:PAS domain S-box-containing protein